MPIDSTHSRYTDLIPRVRKCRDAVGGRDRVVAAGEDYVPKPAALEPKEFERYIARGHWYGATRKTVEAMTGLIFRKNPEVTLPEQLFELADLVTADGLSLREVADRAVEEVLVAARYGILVDYPQRQEETTRTVAQVEADGDRPFMAVYLSESIINWRFGISRNRRVLSRVILEESRTLVDPDDEFEVETVEVYRELGLDDQGFYYQRLWEPSDDGDEYNPGEPIYPQRKGLPMTHIPFYCVAEMGEDIEADRPPLLDVADANLAHWRNSVDYEHGLHFTANPMPVITGWENENNEDILIGSERALILSDPQAKAFFMEFEGSGLRAIKEAMGDKIRQMAALGTRLLMEDTRGVEAAETAAIHRAGENSVLGSISTAVSTVLSRALADLVDWAGGDAGDVAVQLNTDFLPFALDAQSITAYLQLYLEGIISKQTLFQRLQEGESIPPGVDFDLDQERIDEEGMNSLPIGDDADNE